MALHRDLLSGAEPAAIGPDAAVIDACNRFAALEIARQDPAFTDEQEAEIKDRYEAAFALMCNGRATTPDGIKARARALAIWIYPDQDPDWPHAMLGILLRDILGLPDETKGGAW